MAKSTFEKQKTEEDDTLSVKNIARDVGQDFRAEGHAIKRGADKTVDAVKGVFKGSDDKPDKAD